MNARCMNHVELLYATAPSAVRKRTCYKKEN